MKIQALVKSVDILLWVLFLCVLLVDGLFPVNAFALIGESEKAFGLDGSIRVLFFLGDEDGTYPFSGKNNIDALSQTILRLTAAGKPTQSLAYEVHWVESVTLSTERISGGGLITSGGTNTGDVLRYRALGAGWNTSESDYVLSRASFDRFNIKMSFGWGDVTVGRQAVTLGKTYFWNPLDVFFPFDSTQFDRDYKPGVDALRVDVPLGAFSGIGIIASPGPRITIGADAGAGNGNDPQDATWYGSAVLGRVFANASGWDFSLQGGKIYGGWHVGAGAVGDVGPVQIRFEASQFGAMPSESLPSPLQGDLVTDGFLAVFGMGHRFENSLSLDFEYLYNGVGDPDDLNAALVRAQVGSSLQMSRHLIGLSVQYEFTPLVNGRLSIINSLSDGSTQLQPIAIISLADEMDLLAGMMLNFGPPPNRSTEGTVDIQSEFGTLPTLFFLEWKYYF